MSNDTIPPDDEELEGRTRPDLEVPEPRDTERELPSAPPREGSRSSHDARIPGPPPLPSARERQASRPPPAPPRAYLPPRPGEPITRTGTTTINRTSAPLWGEDSTKRVLRTTPPTAARPAGPPRPSELPPRPAPPQRSSGIPPRPATSPGIRPSTPPLRSSAPPLRPSGVPPRPSDGGTGSTVSPSPDLRERIARVVAQLQGERDRISKNEGELSSQRSRLNLFDERLAELEEELRDKKPGTTETPDRLAALEARVSELETVASKVRAGDSALRDILEQRRQREAERERTIETLASRVQELETALATLREQLDRLSSRPAPAEAPREDDLKAIKGIGPKFEKALKALGVHSYAQIAAWTADDVAEIAKQIGTKPQRIAKDEWIETAKRLAD